MHLGKNMECQSAYWTTNQGPVLEPLSDVSDFASSHSQRTMQSLVYQDVSQLYWFRYFSQPQIAFVQQSVARWVDHALTESAAGLKTILGDDAQALRASTLLRQRLDFFQGLETEALVSRYARQHQPVLSPVEYSVGPEPGDRASGIMIADWLAHLMRHHDLARAHIVAGSNRLKSGECLLPSAHYRDLMDGSVVGGHEFAIPWTDEPGQPREIRIFLIVGYDDLEPLNTLGAFRGNKKLGAFYGAIGSIPAELRFEHELMAMLMMVDENVLTRCDPVRVVAGADPVTGNIVPEDVASLGAQFRELFPGVLRKVRFSTSPPTHPPHQPIPPAARPPLHLAQYHSHTCRVTCHLPCNMSRVQRRCRAARTRRNVSRS